MGTSGGQVFRSFLSGGPEYPEKKELSDILQVGTEVNDNLLTIEWRKTATVSIQHINLLFIPPFQGPQFHSLQKANSHFLPQLGWWRVVWLYSPDSRKGRAPNCFLDLPPSRLFPVPLFPHLQDDLIAAHTSASQLSKFLIFSLSCLSGL